MNRDDRKKACLPLLAAARGFSDLPDEALCYLAGDCHERAVTRAQVLCEKGQILDGFYLVVAGRVKLSVLSADGAERVLEIVHPGQTFAEAAAFLGRPCLLHAEPLVDSRLLFLALARVRDAIRRWPDVATLMLSIVAERAHRLTADLEACCLHSAAERVVGLLVRDAVCEPGNPDLAELTLSAAKTVIASSLNLSAETFSRELHRLARLGLIEVDGPRVYIPSLRRLRGLVGVGPG